MELRDGIEDIVHISIGFFIDLLNNSFSYLADSQASKKWLQVQSSTLNSQKKSFIRGLKTSSATLRNLDNLLLGWCNTKLIPATSKCRDATSLCDQKPEALTEEHKEDSELLSNKDRFDNAVTILFKGYNKELI